MRRKHFALLAPPLISVAAVTLVAIRPLFRLEFVCSDDLTFHLLRLVQLDELVRQGQLYSRWAPDMALGYGYPFFNFYAPLSYYVAEVVSLIGLKLTHALIATFGLSIVGAGLAAYALARDHLSPSGSLVTAVAYAFAPYLGYDAFFRGNLAETLAWPFLALALWRIGVVALRPTRRNIATAALSYSAVLLTHNLFALVFSPLLIAYGAANISAAHSVPSLRKRTTAVAVAAALGLSLAAFFWLPALSERHLVQSDRLLVPPVFVYWNNFLSVGELLSVPQVVHPDLLNPSPPRALGFLPVALGALGLLGLGRTRSRLLRCRTALFAVATVTYAWLTTASSQPVWDTLPLVEYVQFPWRLLGPAALCLSVLVGTGVDQLSTLVRGAPVAAISISVLVAGSLFWSDPRYCPGMDDPGISSIAAFERATHTIGTTAKGEYLPVDVRSFPKEAPEGPLDPASIPTAATVTELGSDPVGSHLVVDTPEPFVAVYNGFAYPGWRVVVDDADIPITPDSPHGRITFPVDAGTHHISVSFEETDSRKMADVTSIAAVAVAGVLYLWPVQPGVHPSSASDLRPAGRLHYGWAVLGVALLLGTGVLYGTDNPLVRAGMVGGTLPGVQEQRDVSFEGGLKLLGLDRSSESILSGGQLRLDVYLTVYDTPRRRYQRAVSLVGMDGLHWNTFSLPPRAFREPPDTRSWSAGSYVQDSHQVVTPLGTPPGTYRLELTVFEQDTLTPMRVLSDDLRPAAPAVTLGEIEVVKPQHPPGPDEFQVDWPAGKRLGPLSLIGVNVDRVEANAGDPYLLTTFWSVAERPATDFTAELDLVNSAGSTEATFDFAPTLRTHPTSAWSAGETWRGQHLLHLPAHLESGSYTWTLGLQPGGAAVPLSAPLAVSAPPRVLSVPTTMYSTSTTVGGLATLVGFDINSIVTRPGDSIELDLVWRAETETRMSYHVFVHLVDADSNIVSQSDGAPANWNRPTTGWIGGEFISDSHVLPIPANAPPGDYSIVAGLYVPGGDRLSAEDGQTATHLIDVEVTHE